MFRFFVNCHDYFAYVVFLLEYRLVYFGKKYDLRVLISHSYMYLRTCVFLLSVI